MASKLVRTTSWGLVALFVASALAIFVPPATAQTLSGTMTVEKDPNLPNGRLLPDTGEANLKVKLVVTIPPASGCIVPIGVQYTVPNKPAYASVVLNPSSDSQTYKSTQTSGNPVETTGGQMIFNSNLVVTVTRDAPAFADGQYDIQAVVTAGTPQAGTGCNFGSGTIKGGQTVKNDYLPITVVAPRTFLIKSGQNKKVAFPVDVQNLGNGPTRVKVEVTPLSKNRLDSINPGADLHLESRSKGAAAQFKTTASIEAQTPHSNGYTNSIYTFTTKFTSAYDGTAPGTLATDESTVVFSVQVQGVYVPGFDPTSVIAALGIALAGVGILRRRSG